MDSGAVSHCRVPNTNVLELIVANGGLFRLYTGSPCNVARCARCEASEEWPGGADAGMESFTEAAFGHLY